MAVRRPLVLVSGVPAELPQGDTIAGAPGGGGGGLTYGTATLNFGVHPGSNEATVDAADTAVTAATEVSAWFASDATTGDHSASDHRYAPMFIHLSAEPLDGVGVRIYGRSAEKMTGQWLVNWERN